MKKDRSILYLKEIVESIELLKNYLANININEFLEDRIIQDAVIRRLEIIGEASAKINDEIKNFFDEIPWDKLRELRNFLIHEYFNVDLEIIWNTTQRIIKLDEKFKEILKLIEK
jgi:uncharacterized protein with HEPN domain